jgi:DNA-binding XRE family transcriptional regulator
VTVAERFSANLKRARCEAGLTPSELGRLADLHRTEVYALEKGLRVPRLETLLKLTCSLQVPADALLEGMAWKSNPSAYGSFEVADG